MPGHLCIEVDDAAPMPEGIAFLKALPLQQQQQAKDSSGTAAAAAAAVAADSSSSAAVAIDSGSSDWWRKFREDRPLSTMEIYPLSSAGLCVCVCV
jgi:hypothetical protein